MLVAQKAPIPFERYPTWRTSGWRATVFCLTERGERADELEAADVEILSTPRLAEAKQIAPCDIRPMSPSPCKRSTG